MVLVSVFSYYNSTDAIEEQFVESNLKLINYVNINMDEYLKSTGEYTLYFMKDDVLMKNLTKNIGGETDSLNPNLTYVENQFFNLMNLSRDIDSAVFYVKSLDRLYYIRRSTLVISSMNKPMLQKESWYKNSIMPDSNINKEDVHLYSFNIRSQDNPKEVPILLVDKPKKVFTFSHGLRDFSRNDNLGVISININVQSLERLYRKAVVNESEKVYIINESGNIMYFSDPDKICEDIDPAILKSIDMKKQIGSNKTKIGDTEYLILYSHSQYSKWMIIKLISLKDLYMAVHQTGKVILLVMLVFTLLAIVLSFLVSHNISQPVEGLARFMKNVKGDSLPNLVVSYRKDEIGILYASFNEMINKINFLINEEYRARLREKNAQIKALQSQINPHFLYNTLQSISSMAIAKDAPEINMAVKVLGAMFRYAIKLDGDLVTIREEINHVINYFTIQKLRFESKLEYRLNIPEDIYMYAIPKLTLQPIVENAIIHGIESRVEGGRVDIIGWTESEKLFIKISDNGCGMTSSELENLNRIINHHNELLGDSKGLGIHNVNARIIYAFNEDCGIEISSEKNKGTSVIIKLEKVELR